MSDGSRPVEFLDRVVLVDRQIWDGGGRASIRTRNDTVRAAIDAGWTPHEIADQLGVRPDDVLRWAAPGD